MNQFWVAAVALFFLASLFIIIPAFRFQQRGESLPDKAGDSQSSSHKERTQQNVLIYKERLAELQQDLDSQSINIEEFEQLKGELDRNLLEDAEPVTGTIEISSNAQSSELASSSSVYTVLVLSILCILLIGGVSYYKYGSYNELSSYLENKESNTQLAKATQEAKNGNMSVLLEQLHSKLKENPDDIQGWGLLARTAMNTERYPLAVKGFEQIISLIEAQAPIDYDNLSATYGILAQAQYYASQGVINQSVQGTIDKALDLNPNEANTLSLLGIDAFSDGRYEIAIANWSKIIEAYPNHPNSTTMKQGINEAQKRAGIEITDFTDKHAPSLSISVTLSETVIDKVNPQDTVFIFVKDMAASDAPSPPLAASRHTVSELPSNISLSDANAMGPMAKLSDASSVAVIARVSKTGNVSALDGDLEGIVKDVSVKPSQNVSIIINRVVE